MAEKLFTKEKRKTPRVPVYAKIQTSKGDRDFCFSYAKNISETGIAIEPRIYIEKKLDIKIGETLKLKFKLPNGGLFLNLSGKVKRVDDNDFPYGQEFPLIALEFVDVPDEFQSELKKYINMRAENLM